LDGTELVVGSDYTYDSLNRLTNLTHSNNTSTVALEDFVYDGVSRITQITDIDGVTDYSYDERNQLTGAERSDSNNPDESYSYDANGNRLSSSFHEDDYVTGENNQLESDGIYNYEYDLEGNLIRQTEIATGAVREFEWDYRNRLVTVVDEDALAEVTQSVSYTYDALNRRISKTVDGIVTYFVHDSYDSLSNVALEFGDEDGVAGSAEPVLTQRYVHGSRVDQVLAQEDGDGNLLWHLGDHLGTIRDLVDNSGEVMNHYIYDSFGNVIAQTDNTVENRRLFTGREFDFETGLYYYRARYYYSPTGRFLGLDPIGFEAGDSNLYRYVGNQPIDVVDPTGLYGRVVSQVRLIKYRANGVEKNTPNMGQVYRHLRRGESIDIRFDLTTAVIVYSIIQRKTRPPEPYGGKYPRDDAGHIVPALLGGENRKNNVFSENAYINRVDHKQFEGRVNLKLNNHNLCNPLGLTYTVGLQYDQDIIRREHPLFPLRPTSFYIDAQFTNPKYNLGYQSGNPVSGT